MSFGGSSAIRLLAAADGAAGTDGSGSQFGSYMLVVAALVLLVMYFMANKAVQSRFGSGVSQALLYSSARGFISAGLFLCVYLIINRHLPVITGYSLLMASLLALFVCCYTMVGFKIMSFGSLAVFTVFLMLGGMIVPYLYGVIFLDEKVTAIRIVGIVLMIISLFFPLIDGRKATAQTGAGGEPASTDKPSGSDPAPTSKQSGSEPASTGKPSGGSTLRDKIIFAVLCFAVFMLNGMVSVISKTHAAGVFDLPSSDASTFVMLCTLANGVISAVIYAVVRLTGRRRSALGGNAASVPIDDEAALSTAPEAALSTAPGAAQAAGVTTQSIFSAFRKVLLFVVLAAVFDAASFYFQQLGAAALPASVMYPLQTGGSIVLTALAGFLIFKERPTRFALIGLIITFASTFLFL